MVMFIPYVSFDILVLLIVDHWSILVVNKLSLVDSFIFYHHKESFNISIIIIIIIIRFASISTNRTIAQYLFCPGNIVTKQILKC